MCILSKSRPYPGTTLMKVNCRWLYRVHVAGSMSKEIAAVFLVRVCETSRIEVFDGAWSIYEDFDQSAHRNKKSKSHFIIVDLMIFVSLVFALVSLDFIFVLGFLLLFFLLLSRPSLFFSSIISFSFSPTSFKQCHHFVTMYW
jgi:hypothetical protein